MADNSETGLSCAKTPIDLNALSPDQLLGLRICDLPVSIENCWLDSCVKKLYRELAAHRIKFKPECYLADEWLTPDKEPVIGVPFFLAHKVLIKLEKSMMLEAEGSTRVWCMRLLRHEAGHAINYAYGFYRRKKWQKVFGQFSADYPDTYRFRPYSKSFVRHLEDYYAQYHPDEDFAETFAVWLTPGSDWQNHYQGWKALVKLRYVDELMGEIKDRDPLVKTGDKFWRASRMRMSLRSYYKKRKEFCAEDFPDFHDSNLRRIFLKKNRRTSHCAIAAQLIKKYRPDILSNISHWTGEKKYIINDLLNTLQERCAALRLMSCCEDVQAITQVSVYATTLIANYVHTGRFRGKARK